LISTQQHTTAKGLKGQYPLLVATSSSSYNKLTIERRRLSILLNENIKAIRKSKGLSQEELAIKLNVVRQTISKWEQGLSVPDSDMLISISEVFETPVSTLLGETVMEPMVDDLEAISEKLEVINLQLAQRKAARRKMLHWLLISLCAVMVTIFSVLIALNSPYLGWDYSDPETAVVGVAFHSFEWLFVRLAPPILIGVIVGIFLTRKKV
jgi:putative transcriptional regulator